MFAVIYRFKLKPHQEASYQANWHTLVDYFIEKCGAIGSCLHKGEDGLWVAYSRWPDSATRDAAWPSGSDINATFPKEISDIIQAMQAIKEENKDLEQYDDLCLEVVSDRFLGQ